jgi:predicted Fe-Mo cluster-binding NifX family protein
MSNTKVVAIACEGPEGLGTNISGHFGHTPFFVVAELDGPRVLSTKVVQSFGHGEGDCSMPHFIQQLGAHALVAGGMGARAAGMLSELGIEVIGGASGNAGEALRAYAAGSLAKGNPTCTEHGHHGHGCGHHHHE